VIDISTYSGIGSDTIPRAPVAPVAPITPVVPVTPVTPVPPVAIKMDDIPIAPVPEVRARPAKAAVPGVRSKPDQVPIAPAPALEAPRKAPVAPVPPVAPMFGSPVKIAISTGHYNKQVKMNRHKVIVNKKAPANKNAVMNLTPVKSVTIVATVSPNVIIGEINRKGSNDPLYVVDVDVLPKGENIQNLDPGSIQEINVLKGTNATGLYGNLAIDGVVQVTTKARHGSKAAAISSPLKAGVSGLTDFKGLIIVDGKESNNEKLAQIRPADIESVSVLKDKLSTEIYNEKGKNGVILITLKNKQ
jgi:hypothetical protein